VTIHPHPSNRITVDNLEDVFRYHPPDAKRAAQHDKVNNAAIAFARVLLAETPECADRSAALRSVREARLWANSALALEANAEDTAARTLCSPPAR
jgi:hypothetical protein